MMGNDQQNQGVAPSEPGSQATPEAPDGSSPSVSIPNADDVRFLGAGPDPRGGFTFTFADGNEHGLIHLIAAHLYEMMGCGTPHELNCVQMEVKPRDFAQAFTLTLQREGGKSPLRLKGEAVDLLRQTLEAIETGRSEPLFIMRDAIRNWLDDDLTAQAIEARRAATGTGAVEDESAVREANAPKEQQPATYRDGIEDAAKVAEKHADEYNDKRADAERAGADHEVVIAYHRYYETLTATANRIRSLVVKTGSEP